MKVFVLSQPKAGTYLCANILQELGFKFNQLHFSEKKYERYPDPNGKYRAKLQYPHNLQTRMPLEESLELLKDNDVGVGHLGFTQKNEALLSDFKKIVLTRPKGEILESLQRWTEFSRRPPANIEHTLARCEAVTKWIERPGIFHMTFDDMRNVNVEKINQLQDFLKIKPKLDSKEVCRKAKSKPSITKIIL